MFAVGDRVGHWNWGDGVVTAVNPVQDEVPDEWKHDWQNVISVAFFHLNGARVWVLADDIDAE